MCSTLMKPAWFQSTVLCMVQSSFIFIIGLKSRAVGSVVISSFYNMM